MKSVLQNSGAKAKDVFEDGVLLVSRAGAPEKGLRSGDWAYSSSSLTWFGQVIVLATLRSGNGLQFGRLGNDLSLLVAGRTSEGKSSGPEVLRMKEWIYRLSTEAGRQHLRLSRARTRTRLLPFIRLQSALRLRPRRAVSSAGASSPSFNIKQYQNQNQAKKELS